jgi:hypothetical protein
MAGLIVVAVNRMPAAEVEVSADLVRRLLADQHPGTLRNRQFDNHLLPLGDQVVTVHEQQPRACSLDPHLGSR